MNILILCNKFYPDVVGGAEISTFNFAKALSLSKNNISVITLANFYKEEYIDNIKVYRIKRKYNENKDSKNIFDIISYNIKDLLLKKYNPEIIKIIKKIKPDIIHTQNIDGMGNFWKEINRLNIPIVHTIRDDYFYPNDLYISTSNNIRTWSRSILNKIITKLRINNFDASSITAISSHYAKKIYSHTKREVIEIPNFFTELEIQKFSSITRMKRYNNKHHIFGYIGRIVPEKGIEFLLKTFVTLPEQSKMLLYIAGDFDSKYGKMLYDKYSCPNIIFLGNIDAIHFYSRIDTVIIPSLWDEAFGRVAIEAALSGVDIITSDSGSLVENLLKINANFSFYDKNNNELLKNHILDRIMASAKKPINNIDILFFTEKFVIAKYMELYLNEHEK